MTEDPFTYSGAELDAVAHADNYYRRLLDVFAPYLGEHVVEVGAGIGTFAQRILGAPGVKHLTLVEPATNTYAELENRFEAEPRVTLRFGYIEDLELRAKADSLVAVNVMEHVPDDRAFAEHAAKIVRPGGTLLLFVPAMPAIYGSLDREFGHHRRYTKATLELVVRSTGWDVLRLSYTNVPGVLAWFVAGRMLKLKSLPPAPVRIYDRVIIPLVHEVEKHWKPGIGQSLIAIARRPMEPIIRG